MYLTCEVSFDLQNIVSLDQLLFSSLYGKVNIASYQDVRAACDNLIVAPHNLNHLGAVGVYLLKSSRSMFPMEPFSAWRVINLHKMTLFALPYVIIRIPSRSVGSSIFLQPLWMGFVPWHHDIFFISTVNTQVFHCGYKWPG